MSRELDLETLQTCSDDLASVRGQLLLTAHTGDDIDLGLTNESLSRVRLVCPDLADLTELLAAAIETTGQQKTPLSTSRALDTLAVIEAALFEIPIAPGDAAELVDASFHQLTGNENMIRTADIDDETLSIFRTEATDLLSNINTALERLRSDCDDQHALWEVRRNAHTFKGAAGITGFSYASSVAHRIESLLDKMVEMRRPATDRLLEYLMRSAQLLERAALTSDQAATAGATDDDNEYERLLRSLSEPSRVDLSGGDRRMTKDEGLAHFDSVKPVSTPIVRVSLERLDELIRLSHSLAINQSSVAERFAGNVGEPSDQTKFGQLLEIQRCLVSDLEAKLLRVRMVSFVTLETRLARAVHVTAVDTEKKVNLAIENGQVEVDTQIIDLIIEPLLHLLKNAVVHGIESPETRRLLGKPETGTIRISIEADDEALVLTISDDGAGIPVAKVKQKAVAAGIVPPADAESMTDKAAAKLIFHRGLTTAPKIDLNAGRGVGMSIVKEALEARGGTVLVRSAAQQGTTFTLLLPLTSRRAQLLQAEAESSSGPPIPLILIVDDSSTVRSQIESLVRAAGYRTITAHNGAEALELLLNGVEPDLILSDIEMPQIDGWELLEYVKDDENFGHIPVVMITSLNQGHRQLAMSLGAADLITKPFTQEHLDEVLSEHLVSAMAA